MNLISIVRSLPLSYAVVKTIGDGRFFKPPAVKGEFIWWGPWSTAISLNKVWNTL